MQESKPGIKKSTPPSEWFKNVSKSIGYSSSDLIKSITPSIHSMVGDNLSYGKEVISNIRQASDEAPSITSLFRADDYVKLAKTALDNTIEDITTGKFYNKDRKEAFDDDDFADLIGGLEDGNYGTDPDSEGSNTVTNNITINKGLDENLVTGAVQATIEANKATTNAMISSNHSMTATKVGMDAKANIANLRGLETINENIAQLVNFQNDSMAKYIGASITYYDESLIMMKSSMESIINMGGGSNNKGDTVDKNKSNGFEDVFYGGFSLENYVENLRSNYSKMKDDDMIIGFIDSVFSNQDHWGQLAKSPLEFISTQVTSTLIPLTIRKTMENLDKSMNEFLPAMFNRLSNLSESDNPLLASLGRLLGVDTRVKSSPRMDAYERGAISFDGETKRAVTDVIPTYLRKIYSALSGTKEVAFDWEKGTWGNVDSMRKDYNKSRSSQATNAYGSQYSELTGYMNNIRFNSNKDKATLEKGIEDFLYNTAKSKELITFEDNDTSKRKIGELSGLTGSPELSELLHAMVNNLDKSDKVNLVGAGRYEALANMNKFFTDIESNPTMMNAATLLSGWNEDELFKKNEDGKITSTKGGALKGINGRVDAWGKNDLYYLRSIVDTLVNGIKVFPNGDGQGTNSMLEDRISGFKNMQRVKEEKVSNTQQTPIMDNSRAKSFKEGYGIDMTGQIDNGNYNEKIKSIKQHNLIESKVDRTDKFGDTIGSVLNENQEKFYALREKVDSMFTKPADLLNAAFNKIDTSLYNIVFGIRNDGRGSFMSHTIDKMQEMFTRVADFAVTKVFSPLADMIGGMFKKVGKGVSDNPLVSAIKDGVKYWFVGDKDEHGRSGGVLSSMMNSASDATKSANLAISGMGYTDSTGVKHEGNKDSLFGQVGGFFKDILTSTKDHFIGDRSNSNPTGRRGMITMMTDTIGDGMSEWSSLIFGKTRDKEKNGTQILADSTKALVSKAPRGLLGAAAGLGLGAVLLSGTGLAGGLLTSFFLPGAPLALAMMGGALGIATGFDSFKEWAFGREDYDGTRMGGTLMSQNMQRFMKNNKSTLIGGAIGGVALNAIGGALLSSVVPGAGVIMDFLSPFGPVGAAMQGMATALLFKSESVLSFMFGDKMPDGKRIGGILQRMFKKPSSDMSGKSLGKKGAMIATGILGGMALGGGMETMFGTMGILGSMMAVPTGPIMGAIAGLGASIMLGSDKISTLLFGKVDSDTGSRQDSLLGKFNNFITSQVFQPFTNRMKATGQNAINWFVNKHIPAIQFAFEPVAMIVKETVGLALKTVKGMMWDVPSALIKVGMKLGTGMISKLSDTLGSTFKTLFGTSFKESIVGPMLTVVSKIGNPINRLSNGLFTAGNTILKGLANLGDTVMSVPGMISSTLMRTVGLLGSAVSGVGKFAKGAYGMVRNGVNRNDSTGKTSKYTGIGSAIKGLAATTITGTAIKDSYFGSKLGQFDTSQTERRGKAKERYNNRSEVIKEEYLARRQENQELQKEYRRLGYDKGKADLMGDNLEKFRIMVTKMSGGLTVEEILNSKGKVFNVLSAKDRKTVLSRTEKLSSQGFKGNDLRKKLGIVNKMEDAQDVMRRKMMTNVEDMAKSVTSISTALSAFVNGEKTPNMAIKHESGEIIADAMMQALEDTGSTSSISNPSSSALLGRAHHNLTRNDPRHSIIDTTSLPTIQSSSAKQDRFTRDTTSSIGGSLLGNAISKTKNFTKRQLAAIGCGPIVLSMILSEHGKNISAEDIYKFAEENGLVKKGVGVSSDIFKVYAKKNGLSFEHIKPSIGNLQKLFDKTHSVIARLNTGMGHFVMGYNFNPEQGTIMVKDPMGKIDGTISAERFVQFSTHFYLVYKKGVSSYLSTNVNKIKNVLTKGMTKAGQSIGGALGGGLKAIDGLRSAMAVPVVVLKTKEQQKEEDLKFETILSAIRRGDGNNGDSTDTSSTGGGDSDNGTKIDSGLNRINSILRGVGTLFGATRNVITGAIDAAKGKISSYRNSTAQERQESMANTRSNLKANVGSAIVNSKMHMASGNSGAITLAGRALGGVFKGVRAGGRVLTGLAGSNTARSAAVALSRAGDAASSANLNAMAPSYRTSADAEDGFQFVNDGTTVGSQKKAYNSKRDVNHFLREQAAKASAEMEARFKSTNIDLLTRIEINTRRTAEVAEGLTDLVKNLSDWMKPFLENLGNVVDSLKDALQNFNLDWLGIPNLLPDDLLFKRAVKKKMDRMIELLEDIRDCVCDDDDCKGCKPTPTPTPPTNPPLVVVPPIPLPIGKALPKALPKASQSAKEVKGGNVVNLEKVKTDETKGTNTKGSESNKEVKGGNVVNLEKVNKEKDKEITRPVLDKPIKLDDFRKDKTADKSTEREVIQKPMAVGGNDTTDKDKEIIKKAQEKKLMSQTKGANTVDFEEALNRSSNAKTDDSTVNSKPMKENDSKIKHLFPVKDIDDLKPSELKSDISKPPASAEVIKFKPAAPKHVDALEVQKMAAEATSEIIDIRNPKGVPVSGPTAKPDILGMKPRSVIANIPGPADKPDIIGRRPESAKSIVSVPHINPTVAPRPVVDAAQNVSNAEDFFRNARNDIRVVSDAPEQETPAKGKKGIKSFMKDAMSILKGGDRNGIIAGSGVTGTESTGKLLKSAGKNIGKNAMKFIPGLGLVAGAGFAAMDYKHGADKAQSMFKVDDASKITKTQKKSAGLATAAVGAIPFADIVDEVMFKGKMKEAVAKVINSTVELFGKASGWIGEQWTTFKDNLLKGFGKIGEVTSSAWDTISSGIATQWTNLKDNVVSFVTNIIKDSTDKWTALKTSVTKGWEDLKTSITTSVTNIISAAKEKWTALRTSVTKGWEDLKTSINTSITNIISAAKEKWTALRTSVTKGWEDLKKSITTSVTSIVSGAKSKWDSIRTTIGSKWDQIKKTITDKIDAAKKSIGDFGASVKKAVTGIKDTIVGKITTAASNVSMTFTGLGTKIKDSISGKIEAAIKKLKISLPSWLGGGKGGESGGVGGPPSNTTNNVFNMADFKGSANEKEMVTLANQMSTVAKGCPCDAKDKNKGKGGPADFTQTDPRWKNIKLAGKATMGDAGCGPTVAANAVSALTGDKVLPTEVLKFAQNRGLVDEDKGTSSDLFSSFGAQNGVAVSPAIASEESIRNQLEQGNKLILRGINGANYTNEGHYILADGIKDGKVSIKDPMGKGRSGSFEVDKVAKGLTHAFTATNAKGIENILKAKMPRTSGKGFNNPGFSHPLPGSRISSRYGERVIEGKKEMHWGIDLVKDSGSKNIQAAADGTVTKATHHKSYGNMVIIRHDFGGVIWSTVYAHMQNGSLKVKTGQTVKRGQNLGIQGDTGRSYGDHLHFEIHKGEYKYTINNVNPEPYIIDGGNPTPEGFNGEASTGVAGEPVTGASLLSKALSGFNMDNIYGPELSSFSGMMQNAAMAALFGESFDLLAGTALDPSSDQTTSGSVISTSFNPTGDKKVFVDKVKPGAIKGYETHKVLPSLTLAQAALESGWGKKAIGNNIFGIKAGSSWTGKTQLVDTHEYVNGQKVKVQAKFRDYDSIDESILDHTKLMTNERYAAVLQAKNYREATRAVKAAGYATDPNYTNLLNSIIESNGFMQVDSQSGVGGPIAGYDVGKNIYDIMDKVNSKFEPKQSEYNIGGPIESDVSNMEIGAITKGIAHARPERLEVVDSHISNIDAENKRLVTSNIDIATSGKGKTETTVVTGMGGAWSEESVTRALSALESIAKNTSDTSTAMNNFNSTNNYLTENQAPASQPTNGRGSSREVNQAQQRRNSGILRARK